MPELVWTVEEPVRAVAGEEPGLGGAAAALRPRQPGIAPPPPATAVVQHLSNAAHTQSTGFFW